MAKYNLTKEQKETVVQIAAFYVQQGNQPLVHFRADQGHILYGKTTNAWIPVSVDDLIIFEQEGFGPLLSMCGHSL